MEGMLSRARSCVAHNGCHLTDVVFHAWKYKTSVHSLSFEVSFVLKGVCLLHLLSENIFPVLRSNLFYVLMKQKLI